MRTLLFDIDGTLLLTQNSGSGALKQAMRDEFGLLESRVDLDFSGRTDRSILIELLEKNDLEACSENQNRLEQCYAGLLPEVLAQAGGRLLPGVKSLLDRIGDLPGIRCCVMTGNLVHTARMKLDHFSLSGYFQSIFGGDHDQHRNDLARRAAVDLRNLYGDDATDDMVVIGDTTADIECGHAIGAKVIAVATGAHDRELLASREPYAILDDLSDTDHLTSLLTHASS